MKLFDVVCLVLLGAFLMTGVKVSCTRDWTFKDKPPAISPAHECAMHCWVDCQGAANYMDSNDPPTCVCVPPLDE